jgi:AMP-binding enzyme
MTQRPWFATYSECGIPAEINPDAHRSVVHMLEQAMKKYADKPAFRSFGQTLTYADVDRQSHNFAAYLQKKLGVKKGDRIAVMMPNLLAFPIAFLGIIRAGAAQVNVNPLYTPRELEHQLKDAGVKVMVVFAGSSATVAEVIASTPLETVITVGPGDGSATKLPSPPVDPRVYGVPPEQVVGSSIKTKYQMRDGKPELFRLPDLNFIDDNVGKPVGINEYIGRRPVAAFGNSDGDLEMLQWTTLAGGRRFGLIVHHTDAEREYAYDRDTSFGRLDKALDAAALNKWTVVDMKKDWKRIFAFE